MATGKTYVARNRESTKVSSNNLKEVGSDMHAMTSHKILILNNECPYLGTTKQSKNLRRKL